MERCNFLKTVLKAKQSLNVHFVGIGGISMFGLAIYLKSLGHNVTGSDIQNSKTTQLLKKEGICVQPNHNIHFVKNANVVVYSFATENNKEVCFAKSKNIPTFSRAELLGKVVGQYKTRICVSGAHGKTTTTALIYCILKAANMSVDLHLGGHLVQKVEHKLTPKKNNIIVCEACEYKDAFLNLKPTVAVITNIAKEHLDYFKNFENIKKSFNKFAKSANMLICENLHIFKHKNATTFESGGNFTAKNIKMLKNGTYLFDCYKNNEFFEKIKLNLVGKHNVKNALAAIAVCDGLGINKKHIKKSLTQFSGVERRFEYISKTPFIVHDYAHHPDEIMAVINETKKFYKGKLLIVFQPHTYSRTKTLMNGFKECFNKTEVAIYKTYSAREKYLKSGSAKTLSQNIGANAKYFNNKISLINYCISKIRQNYGVLLLGAGNIDKVAKNLAKLC